MNMDGSDRGGGGHFSIFGRKRTHSAMAEGPRPRPEHNPIASTSNAVEGSERARSPDSLFIPQDDHYDNGQAARRLRLTLPPLGRYEGDGLDMRRPAFTQAAHSPFVDLTEDDAHDHPDSNHNIVATIRGSDAPAGGAPAQRPPRFGVEIVSISDSDDDQHDLQNPEQRHPYDPPQRTRPRESILRRPSPQRSARSGSIGSSLLGIRVQSSHRPRRNVTPHPVDHNAAVIDLTDDDDVIITESRTRRGVINGEPPTATAGVGTQTAEVGGGIGALEPFARIAGFLERPGTDRLRARINGNAYANLQAQNMQARQAQQHHHHYHHRGHNVQHRAHVHAFHVNQPTPREFGPIMAHLGNLPGMQGLMDYTHAAFHYGTPDENRPPSPKYSPPPDPEPGFTRNPAEHEVVVCPNCGDELAVGGDDGKQTVWVIKSCGHAYCGDCAEHRSRSMKSKGKKKATDDYLTLPAPFNKCVVEGCAKPATTKSMVRVYVG